MVMFLTMVCIFLPIQMDVWYTPGTGCYDYSIHATKNPIGCFHRHQLIFTVLIIDWVAIFMLSIRVHYIDAETPAALRYKQQVAIFLCVFLVTTIQWLVYEGLKISGATSSLIGPPRSTCATRARASSSCCPCRMLATEQLGAPAHCAVHNCGQSQQTEQNTARATGHCACKTEAAKKITQILIYICVAEVPRGR